jgi:hypothetical protein
LYVDDFEGAFCWFSQFSQVWVSNVTADEDFIVEAEFVRNALAVFGVGGALRLCLFAVLMAYQLAAKVVGRIISRELMAHMTGMRSSC